MKYPPCNNNISDSTDCVHRTAYHIVRAFVQLEKRLFVLRGQYTEIGLQHDWDLANVDLADACSAVVLAVLLFSFIDNFATLCISPYRLPALLVILARTVFCYALLDIHIQRRRVCQVSQACFVWEHWRYRTIGFRLRWARQVDLPELDLVPFGLITVLAGILRVLVEDQGRGLVDEFLHCIGDKLVERGDLLRDEGVLIEERADDEPDVLQRSVSAPVLSIAATAVCARLARPY